MLLETQRTLHAKDTMAQLPMHELELYNGILAVRYLTNITPPVSHCVALHCSARCKDLRVLSSLMPHCHCDNSSHACKGHPGAAAHA